MKDLTKPHNYMKPKIPNYPFLLVYILTFCYGLISNPFTAHGQDCNNRLQVTSISYNTTSSIVNNIKVSGTLDEVNCDSLFVQISCSGKTFIKKIRTVSPYTNFSVEFTVAEMNNPCPCPTDMKIQVVCRYKGRTVCSTSAEQQVVCKNQTCDPSVEVDSITCKNRNPDGSWNTSIKVNTSSPPMELYILYGDEAAGSSASIFPVPSPAPSPIVVNHTYYCPPVGTPIHGSVSMATPGCVPPFTTKNFVIVFPENCPCPEIELFLAGRNECTAEFNARVTPCSSYVTSYTWIMGDGSPARTTTTPVITYPYSSDGTYTVTVIPNGIGSCSKNIQVTIDNCSECQPNCAGKKCGDDGCSNGGSCGNCPDGKTCVDGNCSDTPTTGGGGKSGGCGWKIWECISLSWCWFWALIAMLLVGARLVLYGNYGPTITTGLGTVTVDVILEAINLAVILILLAMCPCEVTIGIIIGAILAIIILLIQWAYTGVMPPYLIGAVFIALGLIIGAVAFREIQCPNGIEK